MREPSGGAWARGGVGGDAEGGEAAGVAVGVGDVMGLGECETRNGEVSFVVRVSGEVRW